MYVGSVHFVVAFEHVWLHESADILCGALQQSPSRGIH